MLLPGTEVTARGLRWEIGDSQPAGEQTVYRLRCVDGAMRGEECELLWPFEDVEPVRRELTLEAAARLGIWSLFHRAFLLEQALGSKALLSAQPGRLRLTAYQLVPVMRSLKMARPRLMLADGVGLGKTVQAGLVITELVARRRAHRILIVAPAGPLLAQWHEEMRERFGLRFQTLDRGSLQEIRNANELGANPFDSVALGLISIDFAKQEKILQELERTQYDVVVIDEAHHCMSLGSTSDREDSLRRRLAEVLARQSDVLLLLTATPHDGHDPHFASLVELLDPSLVDGRGGLRGDAYRRHIVRRMKRHIKDPDTGKPMFLEREVFPREVTFARASRPAYTAFQVALLEMVVPQLRRSIRQRAYGDLLAFLSLLKRSVSSALACRKTLATIRDRLAALAVKGAEDQEDRKQRLRSRREYQQRLERFGTLSFEEEQDLADLDAEDIAHTLSIEEVSEEIGSLEKEARRSRDRQRRLKETLDSLQQIIALAEAAQPEDPKLSALVREIVEIRRVEPSANILVYTEFTDTQEAISAYLKEQLAKEVLAGETVALSGADPEERRLEVTRHFRECDGLILVSTDATAEGLNLHQRCHHLIHFELPYNPNRLEQRNGRIDRFGQALVPQVRYLYLAGTFEERILLRLISKYERQRKRLTFVPNTLGVISREEDSLGVRLLHGIAEETSPELFARPQRAIEFGVSEDEDLNNPAYKELLQEVERALTGFEKAAQSNVWLADEGLNAEERQVKEAESARERGVREGVTDLLRFVCDAVLADSSDPHSVRETEPGVWELRLPPSWLHGMDEIPGFVPEQRILRLTNRLEVSVDAQGNRVGFLGRAHPIVRRALDKVRNIQFGSAGDYIDRRVSVAWSDEPTPSLLYTYLGTIRSGVGIEFERVIAVRITEKGTPTVLPEYADWKLLTDVSRSAPTAGAWRDHFAGWSDTRKGDSWEAAHNQMVAQSAEFIAMHGEAVEADRQDLDKWLQLRAEQLCGASQTAATGDLFESELPARPLWQSLASPRERLAAFATDHAVDSRRRVEANGTLRLYESRLAELERRRKLEDLRVDVLGVLMLIPRPEGTR